MATRFSDVYTAVCREAEGRAIEILQRALTAEERQGIWHTVTLTRLEFVDLALQRAESAEEVESILLQSADDCADKLAETLDSLHGLLKVVLGRDLTSEEVTQVQKIDAPVKAMQLSEILTTEDAADPEALLQNWFATQL